MDLQSRKLELIQAFLKVKSEEVISKIENILKNENYKSDFDTLKPMSLDEFNSRIDLSIDDSKNERIIEQEELKAKIEKWS